MECRKHNHGSNKGVCPSCLRDKLSKLPNTTSYYVIYRSESSSSKTTVDSSSPASPVKDLHRRAGSMSFALTGNLIEALGGGLKKSRSMAHHVVTNPKKTTEKLKSKTETAKKKSGFWMKLLHLKGKSGGGGGGSDVGGLVTSRQRVY